MDDLRVTYPRRIINKFVGLISARPTEEFNKRDTGLKLKTFLMAFTLYLSMLGKVTLEEMANKCCDEQWGLRLTRQALHARLAAGSKELRGLLADTINAMTESMPATQLTPLILGQFESVNITDATTLTLPDKLESEHKGCGGDGSKSALKIQATYDMKSKNFRRIEIIDNATESDHEYFSRLVNDMKVNELYISDLGYYSVDSFLKIASKCAYFISKTKTNVNFYDTNGKKLSLYSMLLSKVKIDEMVMIRGGHGEKMIIRLTGVRLPETVYSERLRKANKNAKSSGKTLSEQDKERIKWILMITNVERDILSLEAICELYRIRWQIELIFKSWKSYFKLDEMNNVGKDYLDCLIYGKLIVITALTNMYSSLFHFVLSSIGRWVSYLRFMKNIRSELDVITALIRQGQVGYKLDFVIERVLRSSFVDSRRRKTTEQNTATFDLPEEVLIMLV